MSSDKFRYETPMRKSNYREIPIYGLMKSYRDIKQPFNDQKLMLIHNHDCEDVNVTSALNLNKMLNVISTSVF